MNKKCYICGKIVKGKRIHVDYSFECSCGAKWLTKD